MNTTQKRFPALSALLFALSAALLFAGGGTFPAAANADADPLLIVGFESSPATMHAGIDGRITAYLNRQPYGNESVSFTQDGEAYGSGTQMGETEKICLDRRWMDTESE
ncbi:MAG: hypothetical protein JHD02_03115 [Thermoleophilaceae bacterium]|nr:hypothetical protein [Thermoleophilaceae bacterium]